jgi:sugar transferase (PEP-CTERM/EpsH1 system associated)
VRILFLTHRLPYAPNRGDRIRSYHLLRAMRTWAEVDLISLVHDDEEVSHLDEVRPLVSSVRIARVPRLANLARGVIALPTRRALTHVLLRAPDLGSAIADAVRAHAPTVVFAFCTGIAPAALEPPLAGVPLVLDMVDVDSAKWAALAASTAGPRSWIYSREARTLAAFERTIASRANATLVTTERERDTLAEIAPGVTVSVVENGVDVGAFRPPGPPAASSTVVFCGVMNYPPNEDGAIWLAREVWPSVRRAQADARLEIVGSHPTRAVRAVADAAAGVFVTGHVPDVRAYLWKAAVAVAPLSTARGVQNKVLEAVAAGLPVVVTPAVGRGIPAKMQPACDVAETSATFAEAIAKWLAEPPHARRACADRVNLTLLSWERQLASIRPIVERALDSTQHPR